MKGEKRSKSGNFRANLVEFRVEKALLCLKHTVTFGHSPIKAEKFPDLFVSTLLNIMLPHMPYKSVNML